MTEVFFDPGKSSDLIISASQSSESGDTSFTATQKESSQKAQTQSQTNVLKGILQGFQDVTDLDPHEGMNPSWKDEQKQAWFDKRQKEKQERTENALASLSQYVKQEGWNGEQSTLLPLLIDQMLKNGINPAVVGDLVDSLAYSHEPRFSSLVSSATSFNGYQRGYTTALQRSLAFSTENLKKELPDWERKQILDQYKKNPEDAIDSFYSEYMVLLTPETHPKNREVFDSLSDQYTKNLVESKKVDESHVILAIRIKQTGNLTGYDRLMQAILRADNAAEFLQSYSAVSILRDFIVQNLKEYSRIPPERKTVIGKIIKEADGQGRSKTEETGADAAASEKMDLAAIQPGVRDARVVLPPGLTDDLIDAIIEDDKPASPLLRPKIITLLNQASVKLPTILSTEEGQSFAKDPEFFGQHKFISESVRLAEKLVSADSPLTQYADLKKLSASASLIILSSSDAISFRPMGYRFTLLNNVFEEFTSKGIDPASKILLKMPAVATNLRAIAKDTPRDARWSTTWAEDIEKFLSR